MNSSTLRQQVTELKNQNPTWGARKIATALGVSRDRVREVGTKTEKRPATPAPAAPSEGTIFEAKGQTATLIVKGVRTVKDALEKGEVDTAVWEVERFLVNSWEVAMKNAEGKPVVTSLWQVKVWLQRKVSQAVEKAASGLWDRMRADAPRIPKVTYRRPKDPHLLEISPVDAHFGKLAWRRETGEDYDLSIAEKRFSAVFETLLDRSRHWDIEKVLIPLGNDFLHIDTPLNTTGHGTPQDVDGRYPKLIETASMAMVRAIERCRQVAPVELLWVPGNHDPRTSWHVAQFIWAWFRNTNGVTVDHDSCARKYFAYGPTLLGFTHGDSENHRDLPSIMAGERPKDWAGAKFREWHLGHFHKQKQTHYAAGDTYNPVVVRVLPSISGCDQWHYKKGYVKGNKGAEAFLYSKKEGMVASFFASIA